MSQPTVRIVEVSPRDGLQALEKSVPTEVKIELIRRLATTGLQNIEVTSFTSPRWIPQLADHEKIMEAVRKLSTPSITYSVLVPNLKGLLAAAKAGAKEVGVFVSATEGFSQKNNNCSVAEALARAKAVTSEAVKLGIAVRGYVSCIFVCPFDGPTAPENVLRVAKALLDMGCFEISLGDTLGAGTPADVQRLLRVLFKTIPAHQLAGHFHDTYGQALANVVTAYNLGLRVFDSSVGGLGGCPYSPGAKGNLATEDNVYLFENMGVSTGVNLEKLAEIGHWINKNLEMINSSRAGTAIYSKRHNQQTETLLKKQNIQEEYQIQKLFTPLRTGTERYGLINDDEEYHLFRNGSTVKIVLNRPRNGNALTRTMITSLTSLFKSLSKDRSIFHIILNAKGKYFCTGMDLSSEGATTTDSGFSAKQSQFDGLYQLFEAIDKTPQTTIALINGSVFGGGVGLAFVCDIRLARPDVTFTMTEVKYGLCPATISKFVIREWGPSIAREAMLTARPVTAQELGRVGVVHGVAASATPQALEQLLSHYLNRYLKYAAPEASAKTKELVSAAWRYSGGATQDKIIKDVFEWMIAPCDEARVGTGNFRAGNKNVDWEDIYTQKLQLGDRKSKL